MNDFFKKLILRTLNISNIRSAVIDVKQLSIQSGRNEVMRRTSLEKVPIVYFNPSFCA